VTARHTRVLIAGIVLAASGLAYLFGAQAFFYGSYILQGSRLRWNGLVIPTHKPIVVAPGRNDQRVILKFIKSDWSGVEPDRLALQNLFDERTVRNVEAYCAQTSADCARGTMTIAGIEFRYVTFARTFENVQGEHHAQMWSHSPPLTIDFHGSRLIYEEHVKPLLQTIERGK